MNVLFPKSQSEWWNIFLSWMTFPPQTWPELYCNWSQVCHDDYKSALYTFIFSPLLVQLARTWTLLHTKINCLSLVGRQQYWTYLLLINRASGYWTVSHTLVQGHLSPPSKWRLPLRFNSIQENFTPADKGRPPI